MNNTPIFLSVVLSTYNEEKYIAESIKSILNQSYPYFEFIIVNDGSTDNTLQIIKSFNDPRIVIIDKPNSGLPDSLNKGIEKAKYDWIARMDGDDIALPDRFEKQVKYINDNIGVIGGQFKFIDENGCFLNYPPSKKPLHTLKSKLFILLGWNPLAHPTALIRKKILEKVGKYDTNFKASQDLDLWLRLSKHCSIINTSEQILLYRKHANNISSSKKDYQQKLSFLAFIKYALNINTSLSDEEFKRLCNHKIIKEAINVNSKYAEKLYSNNKKHNLLIVKYYLWRFYIFFKLKFRNDIKKIVISN